MNASNDGSESVDHFLARIASLSSKQGLEEAEQSRKAEEEMLQARRERQARRAERARSLSPSKTGPTPSLRLVGESPSRPSQGIDPPVALTPVQSRTIGRSESISPKPGRAAISSLDLSRPLPAPPPFDDKPSLPSPPVNATALSRSGTLSWQQRPASRGTGSIRSRPQSIASMPDPGPMASPMQSKNADEMSRKDIAMSLGAKDPSWFRQTAERGLESAAFRKNEIDAETTAPFANRGMRLPGMSKGFDPPGEDLGNAPEKPTSPTSPPKSSYTATVHQRQPSNLEETSPRRPLSMATSSPSKSPVLDLPAFKPLDLNTSFESDNGALGRTPSVASPGRRPPSPTKGLGGFVESAMMKRSDSVSKRWSVQATAGLKRGDSVATSRPPHLSGTSGFTPGHSRASSKDTRGFLEGSSSPLSTSRPVSSHGTEPVPLTRGRSIPRVPDLPAESPKARLDSDQDDRTNTTAPQRGQQNSRPVTPPSADPLLSRSPSKTMDARRWSPTKASWLESALNKPDSPRFTPAKPETPAWKLNMQRAKLEQQSQSSEADGEFSANPSTSTVSTSKPIKVTSPSKNGEKAASEKAKVFNEILDQPTAERPASKPSSSNKKDGKPTVPSKRNVTPVQVPPKQDIDIGSTSKTINTAESKPVDDLQTPTASELKRDSKPPELKPKPQTPPKTDFRASLKSRQVAQSGNNETEPEFKAVFGKLKRTQTQNYVAPDLLKDNITKGKAALNLTGGPQKTKRVDEFKESILQKKEAMKTGSGPNTKRPESTSTAKTTDIVPEALARRMTLHKTGHSAGEGELKTSVEQPGRSSAATMESRPSPAKPTPVKQDSPSRPQKANLSSPKKVQPVERAESEPKPETSVLAPTKTVSSVPKQESRSHSETDAVAIIADPPPTSAVRGNLPENSKIAARLNPALAGILSRSGSPRPTADSTANVVDSMRNSGQTGMSRQSTNENSSELTHMTKARARGPKRRAPKGTSSSSKDADEPAIKKPVAAFSITSSPPPSSTDAVDAASHTLPVRSPKQTWSKPTSLVEGTRSLRTNPDIPPKSVLSPPLKVEAEPRRMQSTELSGAPAPPATIGPVQGSVETPKTKPAVANKSAEVRKVSDATLASKANHLAEPVKTSSPKKFDVLSDSPRLVSSPPESYGERKAASTSPPPDTKLPLTPSKSRINTPKGPKPVMNSLNKPVPATPSSKASGLGLQLGSASKKLAATPELTPPPEQEIATARMTVRNMPKSPAKLGSSLAPKFETFFGALPLEQERAEFDATAFLTAQQSTGERPKTLSNQIWEVSGDGKRNAMPPQQEHILFEDSMYLCVHSMKLSNGSKSTEVYLWCGDETPEAAAEDAQLFCRKVARENNAKLEVVKQGKESSEFFQALGGIVIIRRSKSSALYMLCGRRHLGHVAFDEVEFSASSLCSGMPFLVSAKFGKLYLWKGVGSNQEDVGCARLIGMDLGLTGEIEEVAEGEEPASFWESFPSNSSKQRTSVNPTQEEHPRGPGPRLYRVEHDRPKSSGGFWGLRSSSPPKQSSKAMIEEIAPFCQKDLDVNHIYILDNYGELYVLVGASAKKPAEFMTAVQAAQEIAMLSPSVQDRPILPACWIVMGEPPSRIKAVFRKWKPERSPARGDQICVRVEEVMRELGITM